jgi:hypothetical protein
VTQLIVKFPPCCCISRTSTSQRAHDTYTTVRRRLISAQANATEDVIQLMNQFIRTEDFGWKQFDCLRRRIGVLMVPFCKNRLLLCYPPYPLSHFPVVGGDRIQTALHNWIYAIISLCGVGAGKTRLGDEGVIWRSAAATTNFTTNRDQILPQNSQDRSTCTTATAYS